MHGCGLTAYVYAVWYWSVPFAKKGLEGRGAGLCQFQLNKRPTNSLYKSYLSWFCTWTNGTFRPYPKTNTRQQQSEAIFFSQGYLSACHSCTIFRASGSSISSTSAHKHDSLFSLSFSQRNPLQELRFISRTVRIQCDWRCIAGAQRKLSQ